MASRITLTIACDDFDHIRALMDGTVKPPGHRSRLHHRIDQSGAARPHGARPRVRRLRTQPADLSDRARHRRADHGDPDLPVSQVSPWPRLHQPAVGHQQARGPDRSAHRLHDDAARQQRLDQRHPAGSPRRAASRADLGGRARRGRAVHAAGVAQGRAGAARQIGGVDAARTANCRR